ncbi:DUF4245 family protein [Microbacterium excoecariae]|uniref:DUF4245 family protein n=1 Tax=Microbacterium excoecariae TaxID=2715210 RepID=UPI00140E404D|nr:DUF4245 family protein [Microbacterium excoecariae]NHI16681.1 DUF4245 domain-containing protein [Microbacterium excoecariae]
MAKEPRIAAHLGRPETPEEEATRKAENSRRYRQSQSFRNLIIALAVSLGIVAVVYFGVPRGELAEAPDVDVAAIAAQSEEQLGREVLVPDAPAGWDLNLAEVEAGAPTVWTINYNSIPDEPRSFVRLAQAFDADETWAAQALGGSAPTGSVTIGGVTWDEYEISDTGQTGNVTYALGTQAGPDHVLIYGRADADTAGALAEAIAPDVSELQEESAS